MRIELSPRFSLEDPLKTTLRLALLSALTLFAVACGSSGGGAPTDAGGSNDAGPCVPPTGYEHVAPLAAGSKADDGHIAMVLDDGGSPMLTWVAYEMSATTLYFAAYDSATCTWKAPIKIAEVGDVDYTRDREVTMSRDPSNGHLGIGYQVITSNGTGFSSQLMLAQSDDRGATWTTEQVAQALPTDSFNVLRPTVAMRNGKTYFAYYKTYLYTNGGAEPSDSSGYILGSRTGSSGAFQLVNVPPVAGAVLPGNDPVPASIAIDDNGNAGLAYMAHTSDQTPDGNNLRVTYFNSAALQSVGVFDSQGQQNDDPDVALAFDGNKPRIAAFLQRANDADNSQVWFSESSDGATFTTPVEMPKDQGDVMGRWLSIAVNGAGGQTIASNRSGGTGERTCGPPKLSTSTDDGQTWATCGPPLQGALDYAGQYVTIAYQPNGKRIAGFGVPQDGVYIWREP